MRHPPTAHATLENSVTDPGTTDTGASHGAARSHEVHVAAGASFTDFAGWQMPVRYTSDLAEHHAVRTAAGLFDLSHMGEIVVLGPEAGRGARLRARRQALGDRDRPGEVLAAARRRTAASSTTSSSTAPARTASWSSRTPSNRERRGRRAARRAPPTSTRSSTTRATTSRSSRCRAPTRAPCCRDAGLRRRRPRQRRRGLRREPRGAQVLPRVRRRLSRATTCSSPAPATRARTASSSTSPPTRAAGLWEALAETGGVPASCPRGLASRDTLRLEAGMPLYGHELSRDILPVQAGLGRVVALAKEGDFVGRAAVEAGPAGRRPGARRPRRRGHARRPAPATRCSTATAPTRAVGEVTSGALSPTLGHPIAMAYVAPDARRARHASSYVDVRGTRIPASVVALPFYKRHA